MSSLFEISYGIYINNEKNSLLTFRTPCSELNSPTTQPRKFTRKHTKNYNVPANRWSTLRAASKWQTFPNEFKFWILHEFCVIHTYKLELQRPPAMPWTWTKCRQCPAISLWTRVHGPDGAPERVSMWPRIVRTFLNGVRTYCSETRSRARERRVRPIR